MPFIQPIPEESKMPPTDKDVQTLKLIDSINKFSLFRVTQRDLFKASTFHQSMADLTTCLFRLQRRGWILRSDHKMDIQVVVIRDYSFYDKLYSRKRELIKKHGKYGIPDH